DPEPASRSNQSPNCRSWGRQILSLAQGGWLKAHEQIILTGQTGTGKTWLACAFAYQAARLDQSVAYARMPRLFEEMATARLDGRFPRLIDKLARVQLLVLDDWGTHSLTDQQRLGLLELFEERYQRRSTIITAQLPVSGWHQMIGEPTIADAILDRVRALLRTDGSHALTPQRPPHRTEGRQHAPKKRQARIDPDRKPRNHHHRRMTAAQGPDVAQLSGTY
ncbi:MAG: ATP-binding protein, partial [Hoeflea sp.]|nr:ATP-binding protein [Hoeflea sp.]